MTTIPSAVCNSPRSLTLTSVTAQRVSVNVTVAPGNTTPPVEVARAEFLAAVATELDVIIINRADLPAVEQVGNNMYKIDGETFWGGVPDGWKGTRAELARAFFFRDLALAEHLEKHPPVDEAQVDALADALVLAGVQADKPGALSHARRLVLAGVRAPEATA